MGLYYCVETLPLSLPALEASSAPSKDVLLNLFQEPQHSSALMGEKWHACTLALGGRLAEGISEAAAPVSGSTENSWQGGLGCKGPFSGPGPLMGGAGVHGHGLV